MSFDADSLRKTLLKKGYFPRELPPAFTTSDFGDHSAELLSSWRASGLFSFKRVGKRRDAFNVSLPQPEAETLSVPKKGYERRPVSVVHPIPQAILAEEISQNWKEICKWLSRQTYSSDKIRINEKFSRGIEGIQFPIHRAKISFIEGTADWIVKSDITKFYHSIYTHSVPWAAYGKENVKLNRKHFNGSLADRLDTILRACNRNQTVGIPVGPETSRIIAEVISARVDESVRISLDGLIPVAAVDRLQDDWFVGTQTLEAADTVISVIIGGYRPFGLDINGEKTSVDRVNTHLADAWVQEILAFLSHRPGQLTGSRLRAFLALLLRLQIDHTKAPIIRYGISVLEGDTVAAGDVEAVESFLLKSALMSPVAMDRICSLIINLHNTTKLLSRPRISSRLAELAERNLRNGHTFEALWQLYAIRGLKVPFKSSGIIDLVNSQSESVLQLVLLDMNARGLCASKPPTNDWANLSSKESILENGGWLLAYEGIRNGWLGDPKNLAATPFFEPMLQRNVVFYDPRRNVPKTAFQVRLRRLVQRANRRRVREYMSKLRGFESADDYL